MLTHQMPKAVQQALQQANKRSTEIAKALSQPPRKVNLPSPQPTRVQSQDPRLQTMLRALK